MSADEPNYEPPHADDIDTEHGPAVTAAGDNQSPPPDGPG
jgi:hypothetical protein